jgi:hypothetical protein
LSFIPHQPHLFLLIIIIIISPLESKYIRLTYSSSSPILPHSHHHHHPLFLLIVIIISPHLLFRQFFALVLRNKLHNVILREATAFFDIKFIIAAAVRDVEEDGADL